MAWKIEFDRDARKEFAKLDHQTSKRILKFLIERLAARDNPRELGEALTGSKLGEFWKYRVGDYCIICRIQDAEICILVVRIGNRREVYR
jgi:mRNA interferase RelE/StbE